MAFDLDRIRRIAESFDKLEDGEVKSFTVMTTDRALEALRTALPALSDTDVAAVAWFTAELLAELRGASVADISDAITDSGIAYGVATCKLVGML